MNYFPFHIGDYASATRHLSWEEDLAYRRLLDVYYTTEQPLPVEPRALCRLVVASTEQQREAVAQVLTEFFTSTESGWIHSRADAEIATMRDKQQMQRDKANKRWQKPKSEPGNASAMPRHVETNAAASNIDALAMPPTPTPTPTPTPKKEKRAPAGSRLPTDWVLSEADHSYASELGVNVRAEADSFRDHWLAETTAKALKADWSAAFRTWCRNSIKFAAERSKSSAPSSFRAQDSAAKADMVRRMTGGLLDDTRRQPGDIIEMEMLHATQIGNG